MSAPSKEEAIEARIKRARGPMPDICDKTIVALADENERLRADLDDCRRVIEMKRADEPLWDKLGEIAGGLIESDGKLKSAQDIEIANLRAERAECLALLERCAADLDDAEEMVDAQALGDPPCGYSALAVEVRSLLAKLRGQQP